MQHYERRTVQHNLLKQLTAKTEERYGADQDVKQRNAKKDQQEKTTPQARQTWKLEAPDVLCEQIQASEGKQRVTVVEISKDFKHESPDRLRYKKTDEHPPLRLLVGGFNISIQNL